MVKPRVDRRSDCPISHALDQFGDRWTLLVVRDLLFMGKRRFGEFAQSEEGIATNILADRLARLEAVGLVDRRPDPDNGRQVIYRPTERALDLVPMLVEMILWSAKHDPKTAAPAAFVRKLRRNRQGFIREVVAKAGEGE